MPPLRFNADLSEAQDKQIHGVSDLVHGEESGNLKFTYRHDSLPEPVVVHMIAHDCMSYPKNSGFIVFSEFDNGADDLALRLDNLSQKNKWSSIEEAVRVISETITSSIEKGEDSPSENSEDQTWEIGSDHEEFDPMETSSDNGDPERMSDLMDVVRPLSPQALANLRTSLRKTQSAGIIVGIYPRLEDNSPEVISLSAPATCLGVAPSILESWGLKQTDNLVLLIKITSEYPNLDDLLRYSSSQNVLQFRFGRCQGEKPSAASIQSAYRDTKYSSKDNDIGNIVVENAKLPFELIRMSSSLEKLLNSDFIGLLRARRMHRTFWPHVQHIMSTIQLLSTAQNSVDQGIDVEFLKSQVDHVPWQSLEGLISQDGALDSAESFSLPLVAMQFALHRLANCTRYCMVCNSCLDQGSSAVKPYVCSKSLCLFQYLSLGLGSSIEHEIITSPYVVDMLICFFYTALSQNSCRELPDGLSIKAAYVNSQEAQRGYVTAVADMKARIIRDLDFSRLVDGHTEKPINEILRQGDRLVIIYREAEAPSALFPGVVVKSWCQLTAFVGGEWTFECYHVDRSAAGCTTSPPHYDLPIALLKGGNWHGVHLFGYWQNIDKFGDKERSLALLNILDGIPSVLDMRDYLVAQPGRRLASWSRLNASELAVLNWTVASNRSLLVQDDYVVTDPEISRGLPPVTSRNKTSLPGKTESAETANETWMQFRFVQGAPEREQRFEQKATQLLQVTKTPTIFAWHGSRLKNWHSIIRTGLDFSVTENGRASGDGVYFSSEMGTSMSYCARMWTTSQLCYVRDCWAKSELQISSAIAVCELINCPSEFVSRSPHYVVSNLDWIQCRYLLVSTRPSSRAMTFACYEQKSHETPAYVLQDASASIRSCSQVIEIPIVAIPFDRRALQAREPPQTPTAAAKAAKAASSTESIAPSNFHYDVDDVQLYLGAEGVEDGLHSSTAKRRGSESSDSSRCPQSFSKRHKLSLELLPTRNLAKPDQTRNPSTFDPENLNMESLRLLGAPIWASTSKQAVRRLTMDLRDLHHRQTTLGDLSAGYYVHTDKSDNMFQWIVELFHFDPTLPLAGDMQRLGCPSVVLECRFGPNYPMTPPFVRVIRPQMVPFARGGGGHVTAGGAVCLELLTTSGWNPVVHIDNVLLQVHAALGEPERPARIDEATLGQDYGVAEAVEAFKRLAQTHQWGVPPDFALIAAPSW
ncbi:ubiquitin-conjugating enzyme E2 Q2 [Cordyceps militaris]|uniref:Ubiquitin-conjugating enzyme E2 Q2 n=1 Tax=Cordyceps militaris TaxID=73501 RepID=A0A2H4SCL7_CORMI|nr:ubiquitin-conjugating enzyme E2 Q2 [Cordyceps militaris]